MKRFKRQSDLIKHACKRAIHRVDVVEPKEQAEEVEAYLKKHNWLEWARRRLK